MVSKWLRTRELKKQLEQLKQYEKELFRTKTELATDTAMRKREIMAQMRQGKVPSRSKQRDYVRSKKKAKIMEERHGRISSARSELKRQLRAAEKGRSTSIEMPEEIAKILEDVTEGRIEEMDKYTEAAMDESLALHEEIAAEAQLDAVEAQMDSLMSEDSTEIMSEFEEEFLADFDQDFADEWDEVPEEVKKASEEVKRKRKERDDDVN
jgi:hypothetical protein